MFVHLNSFHVKKILFILSLFVVFGIQAQAQSGSKSYWSYTSLSGDTLEASSTKTKDFNNLLIGDQAFSKLCKYSITVFADSISGANAGTVTLQVSNSEPSTVAAASRVWVTLDTDTIDGSADQTFHYTGELTEKCLRVVVTSPSGTRKTALKILAVVKAVER